jgi:toxin ParE1/3/4
MARAHLTDESEQDLADIWAYIAAENQRAADLFLRKVLAKLRTLAEFPRSGRARDELAAGLRSIPIGNYVAFYRPAPHGIDIVRILHGARDLPKFFR